MYDFNEDLLQYIWQHKLLQPGPYITRSGKAITVLKTGELNNDSGPDFFNGQIRVNDVVLAGNIEVHIKTSDWLKHNHQKDPSYDHLILHVVYEHDKDLAQNQQHEVEVLEIKDLVNEQVLQQYSVLSEAHEKLPCHVSLKHVPDITFRSWMERMTIERLETKVRRIEHLFSSCKDDHHHTFYSLLCRNFGFKVNALPFELLAGQMPLTLLLKHSDNKLQLDCLLFGMAGFLEEQSIVPYMRSLQNEFEFLRKKYALVPLKKELFKFSQLRPANFPTVRLAQLSALIHQQPAIFSIPSATRTADELREVLQVKINHFWNEKRITDPTYAHLGKESVENILINTFAPFYFFFGKKTGREEFKELALSLLENCAPEHNKRTRLFENKKEMISTSADSQAVINLYENYCSCRKCLKCGIGLSVMANSN